MLEPVLHVESLSVRYGSSIRALRGVDLTVGEGRVVALLGANGAGKTTVLRAASGLLPHHRGAVTDGQISVFGSPLPQGNPAAAVKAGLAHVMEGRRLFRDLSVEENVLTGAACLPRGQRRAALAAMAEKFPIVADRRHEPAGLLSGGQQQLVAIARALVGTPRLLILDEPSLGLSPVAVREVRGVLDQLKTEGLAILIVEQNVEMALSIADDVYVMQRGTISAHGTAESIGGSDAIRDLYLGTTDDPSVSLSASSSRTSSLDLQKEPLPWMQ